MSPQPYGAEGALDELANLAGQVRQARAKTPPPSPPPASGRTAVGASEPDGGEDRRRWALAYVRPMVERTAPGWPRAGGVPIGQFIEAAREVEKYLKEG